MFAHAAVLPADESCVGRVIVVAVVDGSSCCFVDEKKAYPPASCSADTFIQGGMDNLQNFNFCDLSWKPAKSHSCALLMHDRVMAMKPHQPKLYSSQLYCFY